MIFIYILFITGLKIPLIRTIQQKTQLGALYLYVAVGLYNPTNWASSLQKQSLTIISTINSDHKEIKQ